MYIIKKIISNYDRHKIQLSFQIILLLSCFGNLSAGLAWGIPYIIGGPSTAGKTTLIQAVIEKINDSYNFFHPTIYTTRPMRSGEIQGMEYYFLSHEEFAEKQSNHDFFYILEYDKFLYGYPFSLKDECAQGKSYFIIIDFDSVKAFKEIFPSGIFIWIDVSDLETLEQRLHERYFDDTDKFQRRYRLSIEERFKESQENLFDHHIINDDFNQAMDCLIDIIYHSKKRR